MEHPGQHPLPPPAVPPGTPPSTGAPDRPITPPPAPTWPVFAPARVGSITATWRILLGLAWAAGFFAYAAVWQASVQLGIGTWWIGPRADPTPTLLRLAPFLVCLAMILGVVYGVRRLPTVGIVVGAALLAFALPDFSRSTGLAVTESAIASLLIIVSAAARTGMVRPGAPPVDRQDDQPAVRRDDAIGQTLPERSVDGR